MDQKLDRQAQRLEELTTRVAAVESTLALIMTGYSSVQTRLDPKSVSTASKSGLAWSKPYPLDDLIHLDAILVAPALAGV
jgi:hypothetical protein